MNKILLIDGDVLAHTIASACETRSIKVIHTATGREKEFSNRTAFWGHHKKKAGGWLAEANVGREAPFLPKDFEIIDVQTPEPLENCLHSVKMNIQSACSKLGTDNYRVFVGDGSECHRHRILMPKDKRYKQNREGTIRALMVHDVKEYLIKHHEAEVVADIEVDDKLSMLSYAEWKKHKENSRYIVVTRDKDQGQCEGWWFNPDWMQEPVYVDGLGELWETEKGIVKGIGRKFKYFQLLNGDESDGYDPSKTPLKDYKFGDKTAYKLIKDVITDREALQIVARQYREWMPEPQTYIAYDETEVTDTWLSWFDKHWQFVHMLRWSEDFIDTRKLLDAMGCLVKGE